MKAANPSEIQTLLEPGILNRRVRLEILLRSILVVENNPRKVSRMDNES